MPDPAANGVGLCCIEASARSGTAEGQDCTDSGKEEAGTRKGWRAGSPEFHLAIVSNLNLRKPEK